MTEFKVREGDEDHPPLFRDFLVELRILHDIYKEVEPLFEKQSARFIEWSHSGGRRRMNVDLLPYEPFEWWSDPNKEKRLHALPHYRWQQELYAFKPYFDAILSSVSAQQLNHQLYATVPSLVKQVDSLKKNKKSV